jgi:hypothetical protein
MHLDECPVMARNRTFAGGPAIKVYDAGMKVVVFQWLMK